MARRFTVCSLFIDIHNYLWISKIRISDNHNYLWIARIIYGYPLFELVILMIRTMDITN